MGSTDFNLYAFHALDGSRSWEAPFHTGRDITSTPFVDLFGHVYATSRDGTCYCLSPERDLVWSYEVPSGIDYSGPVADEASGLVLFGETGATGTDGVVHGVLHAVARDTGVGAWTASLEGNLRATPALVEGLAIVGTSSGLVYAFFVDDAAALEALSS